MATADQVQVVLEAETQAYTRNLRQADRTFQQTTDRIERNAQEANAAIRGLGTGGGAGGGMVPVLDDAANAAQRTSFQVGNMAAQFQDIGVTAAMGMNPMLVALQQGTQLSAIMNESVRNGQSPVRALGSAFASIISPVSLATIAITGLTVAAIQWAASAIPAAEDATEALEKHRNELEGLVQGYEGAEGAVAAYLDSVQQLPQDDVLAGLEAEFARLNDGLAQFRETAGSAADTLEQRFGNTPVAAELGRITREFESGQLTVGEYIRELEDLQSELTFADGALGVLNVGVADLTSQLLNGAQALRSYGDEYQRLIDQSFILSEASQNIELGRDLNRRVFVEEQERLNSLTADELALEQEIARVKQDAEDFGISDQEATRLAQERLAAEERRAAARKAETGAGRADNTEARRIEREKEAVLELIDTLEFEREALGMTERQQEIANAVRDAGSVATDEQIARIRELVGVTYDEAAALELAQERMQEFTDAGQQGLQTFIDKFIETGDAAQAFGAALDQIGSRLINMGLDSLFSNFNFGGARAGGGGVRQGSTYLVGEKGPELFTAPSTGNIVANDQLGGGGASLTYAPVIDARGADSAAVARLEVALREQAASFDSRVKGVVRGANKNWRV